MKRIGLWLLSVLCFPFFLFLWFLYLFILEPLAWLIQAPASVWAEAKLVISQWYSNLKGKL